MDGVEVGGYPLLQPRPKSLLVGEQDGGRHML